MSIFSSYKKIFLLGFIIVILVAIPFSVYIAQQRQKTTSQAAKSTVLSFEPASSAIKVDDELTLDIVLNPDAGTATPPTPNQVSFVKLSITYDATKFATVSGSLAPNTLSSNTLTFVLEDPVYTLGKATISLSIGADPTRVVTTKTKIATFKLKALSVTSTPSEIKFDPVPNTQVLSIASSDETSENVLSSAIPATVTIATSTSSASSTPTPTPPPGSTPTPTPTSAPGFGTVSNGLAPVCSSLNVDKSTIGAAPYSLTFIATGNDPDSIISTVSFNFGDVPVQILTSGGGIGTSTVSAQLAHTYNTPGVYTAYAILTDSKGNLSPTTESCTKTITINSAGQVTPIPTLPPTGPSETIFSLGIVGVIFTIIGTALFILL